MAYVPDEAIWACNKISPAAWRLYCYYCAKRNRKTGSWNCPQKSVLEDLEGMTEPTYFRAKRELLKTEWITAKKDLITPVMGFDDIKNDSYEDVDTIKNDSFQTSQTINSDSQTVNSDSKTIKNDNDVYISTNPITTPITKDAVLEVFDFWISEMEKDKSRTKLDGKRKSAIERALKNYTPDQLKTAVRGCRLSPFHQGVNDTGAIYNDIALICRDSTKIEGFIEKAEAKAQKPTNNQPPMSEVEWQKFIAQNNGPRDARS